MGPSYAGVLGPLAFAATLLRGVGRGGGLAETSLSATAALVVFAALGYVIGRLAGWIAEESVQSQMAAELTAQEAAVSAASAASGGAAGTRRG